MDNNPLAQFTGKKYLSIETYRKNGEAVATPVWFVEDNGVLYVRSGMQTGKYKRIRNNPHVRVAPCNPRGDVQGTYVEGEAEILDSSQNNQILRRFNRKYGLFGAVLYRYNLMRGAKPVYFAIRV